MSAMCLPHNYCVEASVFLTVRFSTLVKCEFDLVLSCLQDSKYQWNDDVITIILVTYW